MLSAYLQSRVARRIFGLFLAAALVPVAFLGILSYTLVKDHLLDLSQQQLRQESKVFGMVLIGRLHGYAEELLQRAKQGAGAGPIDSGTPQRFSRLVPIAAGELLLTDEQRRHLARGGVALTMDAAGRGSLLAQLDDGSNYLQGTLKTAALWADEDAGVPYCILDIAAKPYHCSPEFDAAQVDFPVAPDAHSGVFEWVLNDQAYLVAYWRAGLQATYANPGFVIVALYPQKEVLAVLMRFRRVFPAVLILALVAAAWLAMGQIRRQMRPLHQLTDGAQRLSHGNFDTEVEIAGEDEFGTLGAAFNLMTLRLKQKFHLLGALGELDRAILAASEMEYVVRTVVAQTSQAVTCDYVAVLQAADGFAVGPGWISYRAAVASEEPLKADVQFDEVALEHLQTDHAALQLEPSQPGAGFLQPLVAMGLRYAWIFPAVSDGRLTAAFIIGFRSPPAETEDIAQVGRSIADRLAVAGSNIAWEEKLYHNAHYDALTNLPNRVLLRDRVAQAINRAKRDKCAVSVMLIDLDRFKEVNDSLGHSAGDRVLAEVAVKLAGQVRESDTVARLGGDEFVVLLTDLAPDSATTVSGSMAEKLLQVLSEPIVLEGRSFKMEASIGIALYPENTGNFEEMLKGADAAMYEAKRKFRGGYRFFSEEINQRNQERFGLVQDLRLALERNEFLLYYQPKVNSVSGAIVGAEALIRWRSPSRGLVPPDRFIGLADEIGLGKQIGAWVLRTACKQLARWDQMGMPPITVAVNVSPDQFVDSDFVASVNSVLAECALSHQRLELEILETTAMDTSESTRKKLFELQSHGVGIALDDFGTGYSSLVYLTQIPATTLKLDREFIRSLTVNQRQKATVAGVLALAQNLDIKVVAEGVEEEEQLQILSEMGCDYVQGYLISRPVPAEEFARLLEVGVTAGAVSVG